MIVRIRVFPCFVAVGVCVFGPGYGDAFGRFVVCVAAGPFFGWFDVVVVLDVGYGVGVTEFGVVERCFFVTFAGLVDFVRVVFFAGVFLVIFGVVRLFCGFFDFVLVGVVTVIVVSATRGRDWGLFFSIVFVAETAVDVVDVVAGAVSRSASATSAASATASSADVGGFAGFVRGASAAVTAAIGAVEFGVERFSRGVALFLG